MEERMKLIGGKMKKYKVLVSEEITHTYLVEAFNKNNAQRLALDIFQDNIIADNSTRDRVECIEAEEI